MNILLSYTPQYFEPTQLTAITKGFILYDSIVFNLAVIANFTLIYIFFRNRTSSAATSHEKCICILLFCELCWAIPFAVQYPFMLSKGESFGFHACQWIGPVLPIWSAFTILAHALLALDRYHTILLENSMKRKQFILIGIIFIPPVLFVAVCPLLFGSGKYEDFKWSDKEKFNHG
ncbi:hypothetical protein BC833DRAFT_657932 [Globomyces pollinis-pini]|nr:hypothetical protein BC833DRAFT_657932 [Globomyces pollinis-pini]